MDDLISRQAAIFGLMKEAKADGAYGYIDTKTACDVIKELPTAEKKGKWLHPYQSHIASECSVCHMQMPVSDYFHFCPHCGAKMED